MIKYLSWVAVLLWMGVIFYFSHEPAAESDQLSTGVMTTILDASKDVVPGFEVDNSLFHHFIRKSAHFTIYLVLGVLTYHACRQTGITGYRLLGLAFGICVLYASSDEFHQLFIAGRSGQVSDVLLDSVGSAAGVLIALGAYQIVKRRKRAVDKR